MRSQYNLSLAVAANPLPYRGIEVTGTAKPRERRFLQNPSFRSVGTLNFGVNRHLGINGVEKRLRYTQICGPGYDT